MVQSGPASSSRRRRIVRSVAYGVVGGGAFAALAAGDAGAAHVAAVGASVAVSHGSLASVLGLDRRPARAGDPAERAVRKTIAAWPPAGCGSDWAFRRHIATPGEAVGLAAVGPGGVFAIEARWVPKNWSGSLAQPVTKARLAAADLQLLLETRGVDVPVVPAVVVWGADLEFEGGSTLMSDVAVLAGSAAEDWHERLASPWLDLRTTDAVLRALDAGPPAAAGAEIPEVTAVTAARRTAAAR